MFGRGTWGTFSGDRDRLSYHGDDFTFVHSGFGHMVLKTGIVGLLLFCALLGTYIAFYMRHRNRLAGTARLIADSGFAGFLFWVPTLLIGTPIIEFRTMLLLGLSLSMPFIAAGAHRYRTQTYPVGPHYAAA
jgi:preprotein translocase subunit SecF